VDGGLPALCFLVWLEPASREKQRQNRLQRNSRLQEFVWCKRGDDFMETEINIRHDGGT